MADTLLAAGRSDKYGQVHVERVGNTGFDDPDEPVALLRAQDDLAYWAMVDYLRRCRSDPTVPAAQVTSVERQLESFVAWRQAHPEKLRKPGTRNWGESPMGAVGETGMAYPKFPQTRQRVAGQEDDLP